MCFSAGKNIFPARNVVVGKSLVDVSDIFNFFCSGGGERGVRGAGRGGIFLLKIPGGGGLRGGWGAGGEGLGGCLRGIFGRGGGAKYFFSGPKFPPRETCKCLEFSFANRHVRGYLWEKNLQGLKSWDWLPTFCRTFFSTGFSLCETFCRTFLQNPNLGARAPLLRTG